MNDKERGKKTALCTGETFFHFFFSIFNLYGNWQLKVSSACWEMFCSPEAKPQIVYCKMSKIHGHQWGSYSEVQLTVPLHLPFGYLPRRQSLPVACIWYLHLHHYEPVTHDSTMTNRKSLAAIQKPCARLTTQNGLSPAVDLQGKYQRSPTDPEGRSLSVPKTSTKSAQKLDKLCNVRRQRDRGEYRLLLLSCYLLSFNLSNLHLRMFLAANLHNLYKVNRRDVTVGNSAEIERDEWNGYSQLIKS